MKKPKNWYEVSERLSRMLDEMLPPTYDVARALYISPNTVTAWRHGKYLPQLMFLMLLKKVFGLPVERLLELADELDFDAED